MNEDLILAVKRGAYFLDGQFPNWASTIDLDTLEMDDCEHCIIGQAVGEYGVAVAVAAGANPYSRASNDWAIEHGFDIPDQLFRDAEDDYDNYSITYAAYQELDTLWTEQVKDRLGMKDEDEQTTGDA